MDIENIKRASSTVGHKKITTAKELAKMNEMEMLYHSNYVGLEVKEIQKRCSIDKKQLNEIDEVLKNLYNEILEIPETSAKPLSQYSWLPTQLNCPFLSDYNDMVLCWSRPKAIKLLGSHQLQTSIKQAPNVDIMLEMPKQCIHQDDCLDEKYVCRRNFYLTYVAYYLSKNSSQSEINFSYFLEDPLKLVILLTPTGSLSHLSIKIHACPPLALFDEKKLYPNTSNISQAFLQRLSPDNDGNCSTSHYNNSILMDMKMEFHLNFLHRFTKDNRAVKDALKLLKIWLIKRQFNQGYGCFSGFIMSMYVALLLYSNKINRNMSSYQIVRNVFKNLGSSKWTELGAFFDSVPNMDMFHKHFEVVFLGPSGKVNLCANMSSLFYEQVLHEAKLSLALMNKSESGIYNLFTEPVTFPLKFDSILQFANVKNFQKCNSPPALQGSQVSHYGNCIALALASLCSVLKSGLDKRVHLIGLLPPSYKPWKLNEVAPHWYDVASTLCIGLLTNCDFLDETLIKGPSADLPEAVSFREFWGDLSELRRFKDGSISEAVYWKCENIAEARSIPERICQHLLQRHCNILASDIIPISSQLDVILQPDGSTSEEESSIEVRIAFQELCQELTSLKDLPLSITNVHGLSPALRSTEPLVCPPSRDLLQGMAMVCDGTSLLIPVPGRCLPPYTQPIEVLCFFESSSKWPEDSGAIRRLKAAFSNAICMRLRSRGHPAYATTEHVYLYMKKTLFQLKVGYQREMTILQSYKSETGLRKKKENLQSLNLEKEIVHRPRVVASLEGVSKDYRGFGGTCRVAKRWLSSHLLINHFSDEAIELLCSYLFIDPAPFQAPGSAQVGFMRFLKLLSTFNFQSTPLIVNFKNILTEKDRTSMLAYFNLHRAILPAMCIMTSLNPKQSLWSEEGPTRVVVERMREVAKTSLQTLVSRIISSKQDFDVKMAFTPSLKAFDVVIYLKVVECQPKASNNNVEASKGNMLPVIDFDPTSMYLKQLEECYGELAIFFHDRYNKPLIGACWRPNAFQDTDFKILALTCKKVDEKGRLTANLDAIVDDFRILGSGLVDFIELRTNKWGA